jgi:glycosyltransferase involved in cell wall biosynthesis
VHNLPDVLVFAAAGARWSGAKVILDLHDLLPEFLASRADVPMDHPLVRIALRLERASCRFADHVITVTEEWRDTLVSRGVPRSKTSVMMNLADPRIFAPAKTPTPPAGGNGHLELLYHGTLAQRYGLDVLLRAVAGLRDAAVPVHLTLHGQGEILHDLRDLARELDLDGAVTFSTDLISTEELPNLIRRADIGVVPYRADIFTDGILPTKLLEYVAVGVPVVASATSAVRSYFDDSMVRLVVPGSEAALVDAIRTLHDRPHLRSELAVNARDFERKHDWDQTAEAYVGLIRDFAGARQAGRLRATSPGAP